MNARKLYQAIASRVQAMDNCANGKNPEWFEKHGDAIDALVKEYMPSGSGIDNGVTFDNVRSTPERLVFNTAYHHMNEGGMYDGWTDHSVIVTPSLASGYNMRITGRDRNDIKEYLHDVFSVALDYVIDEYAKEQKAA